MLGLGFERRTAWLVFPTLCHFPKKATGVDLSLRGSETRARWAQFHCVVLGIPRILCAVLESGGRHWTCLIGLLQGINELMYIYSAGHMASAPYVRVNYNYRCSSTTKSVHSLAHLMVCV